MTYIIDKKHIENKKFLFLMTCDVMAGFKGVVFNDYVVVCTSFDSIALIQPLQQSHKLSSKPISWKKNSIV